MEKNFTRHLTYNTDEEMQIEFMKKKYDRKYLLQIENDHSKIDCFYLNVVPSLIENHENTPKLKKNRKWSCLFEKCNDQKKLDKKKSFKSKQSYLRHVITQHGCDIPGGGLFLRPCSKYYEKNGFKCKLCSIKFSRRDHYEQHLKTHITDYETPVDDDELELENTRKILLILFFFFLLLLKLIQTYFYFYFTF